jgi:hypothetical protein
VVSALDCLVPDWRNQLIRIALDGVLTITGCFQGTGTHLAREHYSSLFCIWYEAHQLHLVMKKAFSNHYCDTFLNTFSGTAGNLQQQQI